MRIESNEIDVLVRLANDSKDSSERKFSKMFWTRASMESGVCFSGRNFEKQH